MSDYISKSALIKNLQDWKFQECPIGICEEETETYKAICECIKAVNEQPTVDEKEMIRKTVERIVERLEEEESRKRENAKAELDEFCLEMFHHFESEADGIDKALKIVKEVGGIE